MAPNFYSFRLFLNTHSRSVKVKSNPDPLFSNGGGDIFWPSMYALCAMLGLIVVGGVVYEAMRGKKLFTKKGNEFANLNTCVVVKL